MAWIFLVESEGSASHSSHGSEQSHTVSETDTLKLCCCREWLLTSSTELQSGTTLHRSAGPCFQVSTSSSADSHVRTSLLLELAQDWKESEAVCFLRSSDSLATFDQDSFSWRTSQLSLLEDLNEFSWSSLRSGMIVAGRLYQPENLAPRTCAKDGGYVPTPTARDFKSPGVSRTRKANIEQRRGIPLSLWFKEVFGINLHPTFVEWMMGYRLKHTGLDAWAIQWFRNKREKRLRN